MATVSDWGVLREGNAQWSKRHLLQPIADSTGSIWRQKLFRDASLRGLAEKVELS